MFFWLQEKNKNINLQFTRLRPPRIYDRFLSSTLLSFISKFCLLFVFFSVMLCVSFQNVYGSFLLFNRGFCGRFFHFWAVFFFFFVLIWIGIYLASHSNGLFSIFLFRSIAPPPIFSHFQFSLTTQLYINEMLHYSTYYNQILLRLL